MAVLQHCLRYQTLTPMRDTRPQGQLPGVVARLPAFVARNGRFRRLVQFPASGHPELAGSSQQSILGTNLPQYAAILTRLLAVNHKNRRKFHSIVRLSEFSFYAMPLPDNPHGPTL